MESPCSSSKPGDLTDKMIFPWLTDERLFTREDAPPLESYYPFYSKHVSHDIGGTFAIISLNSDVCFAHMTLLADIGFVPDFNTLSSELENCLSSPSPIIAVALTIGWIEDLQEASMKSESLKNSSYSKNFPKHSTIRIADLKLHANMVVIDRDEKTVERFEPNTVSPLTMSSEMYEMQERIDETVRDLILPILGSGYSYCKPTTFCPRGPQKDSFCAAWSLFYLHLRLLNPQLSKREIVDRLTDVDWGYPLLVDYLEILKNTIGAIESKSSVYSEEKLSRFRSVSARFQRRGFLTQIQIVLLFDDLFIECIKDCTERYESDPDVAMFWIKFFQSRALLKTSENEYSYVLNTDVIV